MTTPTLTPLEQTLLDAIRSIEANLCGRDYFHERVDDSVRRCRVAIAIAEGREPPAFDRGVWQAAGEVLQYQPAFGPEKRP